MISRVSPEISQYATGAFYHRMNLQSALDSVLPDEYGSSVADAHALSGLADGDSLAGSKVRHPYISGCWDTGFPDLLSGPRIRRSTSTCGSSTGPAGKCEVTCRGAIPPNLRPILERLGLQSESWIDCVDNFGRRFHRAAGHVSLLSDAAARAGRQWFHGVSRCRQAFA